MSAVHQAMMSRYGDRSIQCSFCSISFPVEMRVAESPVRKEEACFISVKAIHGTGRNGLSLAGLIPYLCKGR